MISSHLPTESGLRLEAKAESGFSAMKSKNNKPDLLISNAPQKGLP